MCPAPTIGRKAHYRDGVPYRDKPFPNAPKRGAVRQWGGGLHYPILRAPVRSEPRGAHLIASRSLVSRLNGSRLPGSRLNAGRLPVSRLNASRLTVSRLNASRLNASRLLAILIPGDRYSARAIRLLDSGAESAPRCGAEMRVSPIFIAAG